MHLHSSLRTDCIQFVISGQVKQWMEQWTHPKSWQTRFDSRSGQIEALKMTLGSSFLVLKENVQETASCVVLPLALHQRSIYNESSNVVHAV